MSVITILEELEATGSRLAKEEILSNHSTNNLLQRIFFASLDPYLDYGVRKFKKSKHKENSVDDDQVIENFLTLLFKLASRELTGNLAKDAVSNLMSEMNKQQQKWCERILLKNIRCGVQGSTLNKIWPDLINKFSVSLAKTLLTAHDNKVGVIIIDVVNYPIRVEPKLDGLRCIAIKENGVVMLFTRNGTQLETLPTIKTALECADYDNIVLDSEVLGADWNESVSVMMSSKSKKDDSSMIMNVFDCVKIDDWKNLSCDEPYSERLKRLHKIVQSIPNSVKEVEGITINNEEELLNFYAKCLKDGYEGIMLKDVSAQYQFKRSEAILKMKPITTFEGVIVGHFEGRAATKREGQFGGFELLLENGIITRVGSGFNDIQRAEIQLNGLDSYIGKIIEIEAQPDPATKTGLTKDGKARFPVFVRFRDVSDVSQKLAEMSELYTKTV